MPLAALPFSALDTAVGEVGPDEFDGDFGWNDTIWPE